MLSHMTMQASSIFEPKTRGVFIKSTKIPATNKDAFDYHAREGAVWNDWYLLGVF